MRNMATFWVAGREGLWRRRGVIEKNEPLDEEIMKQNDSTADGSSSKWKRERAARATDEDRARRGQSLVDWTWCVAEQRGGVMIYDSLSASEGQRPSARNEGGEPMASWGERRR